jgi:thiazole/oxazole-forming peptide maturase SagD family component
MLFGQHKPGEASMVFVGRQGYFHWTWLPELFTQILMLCNGYTPVKEIAKQLNQNTRLLTEMLTLAESFGIVQEANNLFAQFHDDTRNPVAFPDSATRAAQQRLHDQPLPWSDHTTTRFTVTPTTTQLTNAFEQRVSCRSFVPSNMSKSKLFGLLTHTYSSRAVPSAGDLRSIMPYVYLFQPVEDISAGLYEYHWQTQELVLLEHQPAMQQLWQAFPEEHLFHNTLCIIVLTASLWRVATKYNNRAYRYANLEAGHAAQNIYLWGAEQSMGVLEYGGYLDRELAAALGVDWQQQPVLTTMFIGKPSMTPTETPIETSRSIFERLARKYVGRNKLVTQVRLLSLSGQVSSRSYANATYSIGSDLPEQLSWGNGTNLYQAQLKTIAEAVERFCSAAIRIDQNVAADKLEMDWLDPRAVAPLSKRQYRMFPRLQPFDPSVKWQWAEGRYWQTGKRILVPIDLVYYPIDASAYDRKLCCYATSSGVAAHETVEQAVEGGLLELIERDAFVLAWHTKPQHLAKLDVRTLQGSPLADYVTSYSQQGAEVSFITINNPDKAAVVLCIMKQQKGYGKLGVGAGASFTSFAEAAEKAFYEAECVWLTQPAQSPRIKSAKNVKHVADHLNFYQNSSRQGVLNSWYQNSTIPPKTVNDSVDRYNPIVVDLYTSRSLQVVRVIEPALVPMSFGHGQEHYLHPRFQQTLGEVKYRFPGKPHCFV